MSMQRIRDTYNVPAKRGGRVEFYGIVPPIRGTIIGSDDGEYVRIRLDGPTKLVVRYHPTYCLRYLDQVKDAGEYGPSSEVLVKSLRILMGTDAAVD